MKLEEIEKPGELESSTIEYKERLNHDEPVGWLKTIAGFANADGGDFYIGVEDKTHKLIGFDRNEADKERNFFNNQINEHLTPRPQIKVTLPKYKINESERYIIHAKIEGDGVKPVVLKYNGVPSIFMRRDGFTNGATYEEIINMSIHSQNTQYDSLYTDIPYDRSEFTKLQEFCKTHNNGKGLTDKALRSIGFFDEHGMISNGASLFRDNYQGNKSDVMCSVFSGFSKGSERIVTVNRFSGNLTDCIQYIREFVEQRMNHSMIKLSDRRINVDSYPSRAVFEGVINAVAHRDYYLDGTQIQVDIFRDRLEISSPGSFYRGEKVDKTYNLSSIISKRRNEIICAVLVACNVMEAAGTGFDKITEEYASADQAHRPFIYSRSDHFTLVLPDLTWQDGIQDPGIPVLQFVPVPNGTELDGKVLEYCYDFAHNAGEIAEYLHVSDSTYLRKRVLGNLVDTQYLNADQKTRTRYYRTNPEMVHT